jgi:outer membrane protein OmpA-like peptidoglycan-associated protein
MLPAVDSTAATRAQRHEMDRDETLLREWLSALPRDSGVVIAREETHVTLRFPAVSVFDPDSSSLSAEAMSTAPLLATLKLMQRRRALSAQIAVYTDSIGGAGTNQSFSDVRAKALASSLISAGIPAPRLQSQGGGAGNALAGNDTPEGRSDNRRVEIAFQRAAAKGAAAKRAAAE